jgi:hypothetical protein
VILDFGLNPQPFAPGGQVVTADHGIVMGAYTTERLLAAIGTTIERHEQTFGAIEMDVNRRVSPPPASDCPGGGPRTRRPAPGAQAELKLHLPPADRWSGGRLGAVDRSRSRHPCTRRRGQTGSCLPGRCLPRRLPIPRTVLAHRKSTPPMVRVGGRRPCRNWRRRPAGPAK